MIHCYLLKKIKSTPAASVGANNTEFATINSAHIKEIKTEDFTLHFENLEDDAILNKFLDDNEKLLTQIANETITQNTENNTNETQTKPNENTENQTETKPNENTENQTETKQKENTENQTETQPKQNKNNAIKTSTVPTESSALGTITNTINQHSFQPMPIIPRMYFPNSNVTINYNITQK